MSSLTRLSANQDSEQAEDKSELCTKKHTRLELGLQSLRLLLLLDLEEQGTVDVRENTTESDGGADERVKLLITTNGELEVTRGDTLDLEILGSVLWQVSVDSDLPAVVAAPRRSKQ